MINNRLSPATQIVLGILVALLLGFLFGNGVQFGTNGQGAPSPVDPTKVTGTDTVVAVVLTPSATLAIQTVESTQRPFVTLPDLWLAQVVTRADTNPEVTSLSRIAEGRLTVSQPGNSVLSILDISGQVLYSLSFQTVIAYYDLPIEVDETSYFFVLPSLEDAQWLQISTPNGETKYRFPDDK